MIAPSAPDDILLVRQAKRPLSGEHRVPGDKSISHRAVMFGALAEGITQIRNFLPANDCMATVGATRTLGITVETDSGAVVVHGRGLHGLQEPARPVECGGSGTTMRLLAGLLAGQPFYTVLAANAQLGGRPMDRVTVPLRSMGATILGRQGGKYAPLFIAGGGLRGIRYESPVASAQVKSAVLLAGLLADGPTTVVEKIPTRDHTECMLAAMGANIETQGRCVTVQPGQALQALNIDVPSDFSSAAFLLVAACIVPGSRLVLTGVGVSPGRTGIMSALRRMGAEVVESNHHLSNGEPVADLTAAYAALRGIEIAPDDVPGMIDELPVLAVAATQAQGITEVRGAGELRVKETDRIATTVAELTRMGANIRALPDGFRVEGPTQLCGATVSSHGDHRLAMALAIAALAATGETVIEGSDCTRDSFPGFERMLTKLCTGDGAL